MVSRSWEHRRCRGIGGAHPGRISCVWNVATPLRSGACSRVSGNPTVREGEFRSGHRMPQKRMPVAERRQEPAGMHGVGLHRRAARMNWPDTGWCPTRKGADRRQVSR
jgi:hypothetical protein